MTGNAHWILPQGIEEALPQQAIQIEYLRRKLLDNTLAILKINLKATSDA